MSGITCGFIGLGLIGGSIARALKQSLPQVHIVAHDTDPGTLRLAQKEGIADRTASAVSECFRDCDYIFLCAPVQGNDSSLETVRRYMKPGCLLTDVGSVKTPIHEAVHRAGLDSCFVGGHPMAGSERTGFANSKASLLENAYYILTPAPGVPGEKLESFRKLVEKTGAIPLILDCHSHDYVTAAVSHLPHVVAASLVSLVEDSDSADGIMKLVAAGGFKDITRIASSSALMWQQICLANGHNISSLLSDYITALEAFRDLLETRNEEGLYQAFDRARLYRDSFIGASSGPIKRSYRISVDIADKSGALARITMLLATQDLSIKNIGITHNRESEDGVLKVEFYDEASQKTAAQVLGAEGYEIHVRTIE